MTARLQIQIIDGRHERFIIHLVKIFLNVINVLIWPETILLSINISCLIYNIIHNGLVLQTNVIISNERTEITIRCLLVCGINILLHLILIIHKFKITINRWLNHYFLLSFHKQSLLLLKIFNLKFKITSQLTYLLEFLSW